MLFLDLAPPTLQNSGIFDYSTRRHLNSDGFPPKSRRPVVSIYDWNNAIWQYQGQKTFCVKTEHGETYA